MNCNHLILLLLLKMLLMSMRRFHETGAIFVRLIFLRVWWLLYKSLTINVKKIMFLPRICIERFCVIRDPWDGNSRKQPFVTIGNIRSTGYQFRSAIYSRFAREFRKNTADVGHMECPGLGCINVWVLKALKATMIRMLSEYNTI